MPTMPTIPPETWRLLMTQGSLVMGLFVAYIFIKIVMLRMTINGKVGCFFQEANGNLSFELIKYQQAARDNEPILVSGRDKQGYQMDIQLQRRILYPAGAWRFMQENIPAQCFVRGHYAPVDWYRQVDVRNPAELSVMMKNAKNTAVATDVIGAIADKLGASTLKKLQTLLMVGLLILGVGLAGVGDLSYQNYAVLQDLDVAIGK